MIALEDLKGRLAGASVALLTGGTARSEVRAYAASTGYFADEPPEETWLSEVQRFVDAGFTAAKLRIGRYSIEREAKALARLRQEIPDNMALMADGNAAYTMGEALNMGARLQELGFEWFEEPLPQHPLYPAYEHLTRSLPIPIAGGEGVSDRGQAMDLVRRRGVDIFQPEPVICGGVGEAVFMAELARVHGISSLPHTSGGGIGLAAALQVLATIPDHSTSPATWGPYLELGTDENPCRTRLFGGAAPFRLVDGRVTIPTGPGLGVEVDEEWVRAAATETTDSARA
jgi:D-galactarolactone cycloisomerase